MAEVMTKPTPADKTTPPDLDKECETWAWVRAAGVSAQELRAAVQQALTNSKNG